MYQTEKNYLKKILNDMLDMQEISEADFLLASKLKANDFMAYIDTIGIPAEKWSMLRSSILRHINNLPLPDNERQECEIWTRVMGYFRPVSEFNQGKKAEFYGRKNFSEIKASKRKEKR